MISRHSAGFGPYPTISPRQTSSCTLSEIMSANTASSASRLPWISEKRANFTGCTIALTRHAQRRQTKAAKRPILAWRLRRFVRRLMHFGRAGTSADPLGKHPRAAADRQTGFDGAPLHAYVRRAMISRLALFALISTLAAQAVRAQQGPPRDNPYDVIGKVFSPFWSVLPAATESPNKACTMNIEMANVSGRLPNQMVGASLQAAVQFPDKVKLTAPVLGEDITVCRDG